MPFLFAVSIAFLMVGCLGADTSDPKQETEPMASDMGTAGSSTDAMTVDMAQMGALSCADEDDLFGAVPSSISVGFNRGDLFLCSGSVDRFELSGTPGQKVLIRLMAMRLKTTLIWQP